MNISFQQGAHPLVAKNWDKKKTLKENYKALGLLSTLNGYAGGQVINPTLPSDAALIPMQNSSDDQPKKLDDATIQWKSISQLDKEKKLDAIDQNDQSSSISASLFAPLEPEIILDSRITSLGTSLSLRVPTPPPQQQQDAENQPPLVITQMKQESLNIRRVARFQSHQESLVYSLLMDKWGAENYEDMARDLKLNVYQLSAGQLKKKLTRAVKMVTAGDADHITC